MKKYKYWLTFLLLVTGTIFVIIITSINIEKPNVNAIVELREAPNDESFKEIYIEINISNARNSSRDILIPQLSAIDKLDKIRSKKFDSSELNNVNSSQAQSISSVIFDMDNLTFDQIKNCYKNDIIIAKVITKKGNEKVYKFNIGESLIDKTSK